MQSLDDLKERVNALASPPIAFEAHWAGDGDWYVNLFATTKELKCHPIATFSEGGDIRVFNGQVPPWPEAEHAAKLGQELADHFRAEFYFPSPNHPEYDCPKWLDKAKGYPCRRCGILLLQRDDCRWRGICNHCDIAEEREKREAGWTPEERAGPKCHICGNPAKRKLGDSHVCTKCDDKYDIRECVGCGISMLVEKSVERGMLCGDCKCRKLIDSLTESQRDDIRTATAKGKIEGLVRARALVNCSLYEAIEVLNILAGS